MQALQQLPVKYLQDTENKIDRYTKCITNKAEKTLVRLCKWEAKVKRILQRVSPDAASRLFSNEALSFKGILLQYKKGELAMMHYRSGYDEYIDDLSTQLKYLDSNKNLLSGSKQLLVASTKQKSIDLEEKERAHEVLQKMIIERKKELIAESIKHLGKNKQLQKINKEAYYYTESIKNYRQLFEDKSKREEIAIKILSNIPGFKKFMNKNSLWASMFGMPDNNTVAQNLSGLQTSSLFPAT